MILDGKKEAQKILKKIQISLEQEPLKAGLAVILIGNDPASHLYVSLKEKAARNVGIFFEKFLYPETVSEAEVLKKIQNLNTDNRFTGIIVQFPLPVQLRAQSIINAIDPKKDVDGFHPDNLKRLHSHKAFHISPVALSVEHLVLLAKPKGKKAVIIANSEIFSLPIEFLLTNAGFVCTLIKPDEPKIKNITLESDVIVIGIGRPHFLTSDMVRADATIIDIGTTKVGDATIGDTTFESLQNKVHAITPVPGGIGPMTVAFLLKNTLTKT